MSLADDLPRRLLLALAFSVAAVVGLGFAVEACEVRSSRADGSHDPVGSGRAGATFELRLPDHRGALGCELAPLSGSLAIAGRVSDLPADVAPVVEVLADGSLAIRRPVPLAEGPASAGSRSRDGYGAGLVLPGPGLAQLSAAARGALGGLLSRWFPARPLPRQRLRSVGYPLDERDLERILRWIP